jgi:hypothetical protein
VNVETKQQTKQWIHTHSSKKPKKFKQTSACQKANGNCFLGQEKIADGGIHATRGQNFRSVLRNTEKKCMGHSEQKSWNADIQCTHSAPPRQFTSAYSFSHSSTAGAIQLGVV